MSGISPLDLAIIALYFTVLIVLGFTAMHRIKNQEDFFLGGRRFGKVLQVLTSFGQATSSENVVGTVTATYRDGAGGTWSQLLLLWATPLYWFTARWYRRMRMLTLGDFFHHRYGSRRMATLYSATASFYMVMIIAVSLKAVGVTVLGITLKTEASFTPAEQAEFQRAARLQELTAKSTATVLPDTERSELTVLQREHPRREFSSFDDRILTWAIVGIILIYALLGGLEGAAWSDSLQSVMIVVLSFLLIPFAVAKLNLQHGTHGVSAIGKILHEELPGYFFSPFGSAQSAEFTWYFIFILSIMATLNVAVQANQLTANASARDEMTAAVGFTTGTFIKRFLTVIWGFVALLCFALYGREIQNSDLIWGVAARDLLGGLGVGLVGLMIACLLAALQASASTLMLSSSALLTRNVYAPLFPNRSDAHYIKVGRMSGALFLIVAALLCTAFSTVLDMLKFLWEFNAVMAASFWCGLKWRRANRPGAWASISTALLLFIILPAGLPSVFPQLRTAPSLQRATNERRVSQVLPATSRDVEDRARQIKNWRDPRNQPPAALLAGESVRRDIVMPPRSIYWSQGFAIVDGQSSGRGFFLIEMWALDHVFDLSANPYALNETIRYIYKILLPFLVLMVVSRCTPEDNSERVRQFFLRMRTRVQANRPDDESALAAAYAEPETTRALLLFPKTNFEFFRWTRTDAIGFAACILVACSVVGFLHLLLSFGA